MKTRATYSPEEKMDVIIAILSRKTTIQKVSKEKGIAPTLISLWKKQAEDAMLARFQPQPKGRKKSVPETAPVAANQRVLKNEARKAKIKAAHLEASLKDAKARISALEASVSTIVTGMGYKLTKVRQPRRAKAAKA